MNKAKWPKTLRNACLAGFCLMTLVISGCASDGSSPIQTVVIPTNNTGGGGTQVQTGKVILLLADPVTGQVPPQLQKTLRYQGVNNELEVTFGPFTRDFSPAIEFDGVPVGTTGIELYDPNDSSVFAEVEVVVRPGKTTYATDVVFHPGSTALGNIRAKTGDPLPVGAGFIQTQRSSLGPANSSPVMAGFGAASVTTAMQAQIPYKTNSWLSPVLWADNHTPYYIGGRTETAWQQAIYPKPWCIRLNRQEAALQGLNLALENVRSFADAQLPNPAGEAQPPQAARYTGIQGTFTQRTLSIRPGFTPLQMKVARIGDYDADFVLRGSDDPDFDPTILNADATVQMTVVRGNPMLYFKTIGLHQIDLAAFFVGTPTNTPGTVDLGGGKTVAYNVFSANFDTGAGTIVVFYDQSAASLQTTTNLTPARLTFSNTAATPDAPGTRHTPNYFAIVALPGEADATPANLSHLAAAAFSVPTNTTVTYTHDAASQTVEATYQMATQDVLGSGNVKAISGLLPNHYANAPTGAAVLQPGTSSLGGLTYKTVRGNLKVYNTGTFKCRYPYAGILPFLPPLDSTDAAGRSKLAEWTSVYVRRHGSDRPPYTGTNIQKGQQAYELGKFLARNGLAAASIADNNVTPASDPALAAQILSETKNAVELFFRQSPTYPQGLDIKDGAAPYYLYYDPRVGAINQYPQGTGPSAIFPSDDKTNQPYESYGAVTLNNDHHFHYGYYIFAAAQLALRDPAWGAQWKGAINQMIFDVANDPAVNSTPVLKYPKMRNWDYYQNFDYAAGFNGAVTDGNNQESVSEDINFWNGVILWGAATGQQALMEHGICHYAALVHTSWTYWFDPAGMTAKLAQESGGPAQTNWPGPAASRLFDAYTRFDTFFGVHAAYGTGIVMIPITGGSFYHNLCNTDFVKTVMQTYDKHVTDFSIDPLNPVGHNAFDGLNQWINGPGKFYALFAKYYAMSDPTNAIAKYWNVPSNYDTAGTPPDNLIVPNDKFTDVGDSGIWTYHWIQYIKQHGKPDPTITSSDTPFYMTFVDTANGKKTYAAYNHTNAALTVNFSDGGSLSVPPHQLASKTVP